MAVPTETPVTTPLSSTRATSSFEDDQNISFNELAFSGSYLSDNLLSLPVPILSLPSKEIAVG